MTDLDVLLANAREADPGDRINYRDAIATHGELAIDAMADWLSDPRLAAFAIRVLQRIGDAAGDRQAVVDVLRAVDRAELPRHLVGDLDRALGALGASQPLSGARRSITGPATAYGSRGTPGVPGRGYWVMRTSQWERPYIWTEARQGRLRQGWGLTDDQNLEVIATALRRGEPLNESQQQARRALRMLASWDHGMRFGDVVVTPHLPELGRLSVFRVIGSYTWSPDKPLNFGDRFGHLLPVELLAADIDRYGPNVSSGLRAILGVQTRLYNISGYGGDVERLIGGDVSDDRWGELWTEAEYERLFGRFPPDEPRPSDDQIDDLAAELGRTRDAVSWQWGDGASYAAGGSASTTSQPLKGWLDRKVET